MSKKDFLATLLYRTGLLWCVAGINRILNKRLIILAYHRVLPDWDEDNHPGDLELISASTEEFDWQMQHIKKHYTPIHFRQAYEILKGERYPDNSIIVTFDDGFVDNHHYALPILQKSRIPATVFISTDYIGSQNTFWFERVAELHGLLNKQGKSLRLPMLPYEEIPTQDQYELRSALKKLLKVLKKAKNNTRLQAIAEMEELAGVPCLKVDEVSRPMTWDEVRELKISNVAIESHSCSHPVLSQCDEEQLENEILSSKKLIEEELGECEVMSYPVGGDEAYDQRVLNLLKEGGYIFGCTYTHGVNKWTSLERYQLKRIHVERYVSRARFYASMELPWIF